MNKKTIGVSIIISVFLIGVVSAGLLDYFGQITGSVEVEGPVFYLSNETATGEAPVVAYKLLTNNPPSNKGIINFIDGHDWDATYFVTEPLGVDGFYKAEFTIRLLIKTNWDGQGNQPILNITIITLDGSEMDNICSASKNIGATQTYGYNTISCSSKNEIDMTDTPKFGLKLGGEEGIEYSIKTGYKYGSQGYSEIEVTSAT